jgi:signal transduction histidine kinase
MKAVVNNAVCWCVSISALRRLSSFNTSHQAATLINRNKDARISAERANDAKSRYVIGISHELRTPLNSILGYSQLLQKQEQLSNSGVL